jgi:protein-disulfide isomerase
MTDFSSLDVAKAAVADPATSPEDLNAIANAQPKLWTQVAAHPNAYPALLDWLETKGDAKVKAAVTARRDAAGAPLPPPVAEPPTPAGVPGWVTSWLAVLTILVLGLGAFSVTMFVNRDTSAPADAAASATATPLQRASVTPTPSPLGTQIAPPNLTPDKAAIVADPGAPASALVVDVDVDYQCPVCKAYENFFGPTFEQLEASGDIQVRYHILSFLDNNQQNDASLRAGMAAACADTVGKFQAYHFVVFANQPTEGVGYTDEQLRSDFAGQAGITGDDLTKFQTCHDTWPMASVAQNMNTINLKAGITGTPTFQVNGKTLNLNALQTIAQSTPSGSAPDATAVLKALKDAAAAS